MKQFNVYAIGNALVDMEFEVRDEYLRSHLINKGGMTLVDEKTQNALLASLGGLPIKKQCGGSAANTVIAVSQMGGKCFYSCRVANDEAGDFYLNDLTEAGVGTNLTSKKRSSGITGKCLVMITPDAERSMNTFLGITSNFCIDDLDESALKNSEYLYIEGYLAASETGVAATLKAKEWAKQNNIKIAMTISDLSMIQYFGENLLKMLNGHLDLIFCNETEALALCDTNNILVAREKFKQLASKFVITRGENGAMIFDGDTFIDIEPYKVKAVDSNGAGDMFAGAFLYGITHGHTYASSGKLASLAASKVVSQYGPRLKWHQTQEILKQVFNRD